MKKPLQRFYLRVHDVLADHLHHSDLSCKLVPNWNEEFLQGWAFRIASRKLTVNRMQPSTKGA